MAPEPPTSKCRTAVGAWLAAGFVGLACAVGLTVLGPFRHGPPLLTAAVAIVAGGVAMVLCAPWRRVLAWREAMTDLSALAEHVRRISREDKEDPERDPGPRGPLFAERDDPIGVLDRAIQALLEEVAERRRELHRQRRREGEMIKRETHRQTLRLKREALTDPLTGLANRRSLYQRFRELRAEHPGGGSIVAMAVDLDLFKVVNDTLGHETGDACLRFLGELLQSSLRREDLAVRLGGDEFLVLMPGVNTADARAVAERLCSLFRQMPWSHTAVERPTLSVGLASSTFDALGDGRELLRRADEALYAAKRNGRARVCGDNAALAA